MTRLLPGIFILGGVAAAMPHAQGAVETLPVQGNVHLVASAGGNTTVQIGDEGPVLVDTQPARLSDAVLAAVRTLTPHPIRHIILTSGGDQQSGGAANLARTGRYIRVLDSLDPRGEDSRSSIIAHLNVLNRMVAANVPVDSWPTDTYFTDDWALFANGEAIQLFHVPNAHSDGDTVVFFRRSDVVSTGAIFDTMAYPRFDPRDGGGIAGILDGLNLVIDIAIPGEGQTGGTVIVPGRGHLGDETDVADYRDMVTIIRDRIQDMVERGLSLAEVQAAGPTADYDVIYDRPGADWTAAMFVEAIYRDLSRGAR